jgi:hypothetical protein
MKQQLKYIFIATLLAVLLPSTASAKVVLQPKAYLFGFVANFTDSVVYFTDIQEIEGVCIDSKTKFLMARDEYANQLRNYFTENMKMPHRTCVVSYALTRKDAEKKLVKFRKLYTQKYAGKYEVKNLNENEFKFIAVNVMDNQTPELADSPKDKKKKIKKQKKDKKKNNPDNPSKEKPLDSNLPPAEVEMK